MGRRHAIGPVALGAAIFAAGLAVGPGAAGASSAGSGAAAGPSGPAGPGRRGAVPTGPVLRFWALQNENVNSNYQPVPPAQAVLDAARFSYITAHPVAYAGDVAAMKAVNPALKLLAYENGVFAQAWQGDSYPADWYLYDASGNKVVNPKSGNYLMDPTNPGWIANRVATCEQLVAESGYDGCYLDMLGLASLRKGFVSAHPIDPYLSPPAPWPLNSWIQVTAALAGQVRSAVAPAGDLVMGNGLNSGALYYNAQTPTKPLLDAMDGAVAEAWLRGSTIPITTHHTGSAWAQDVALVAAGEAAGKPVLGLVKIGVSATPAQQAAWQQYSLATFLMGAGGLSALEFTPSSTASRTAWYAMNELAVGRPTGPMRALPGGVCRRMFANGMALVDPTPHPLAVSLPKGTTYYDVNGTAHAGRLTLPANSGLVLRARLTPVVQITSAPPTPTSDTSATITFSSATTGASFSCSLDGAAPAPCSSPVSYTGLAPNAPHLLAVTATSPSGLAGWPADVSWGVDDGTAPVVTVGQPPDGPSTDVTVLFGSSKAATAYSCSLDGSTPQPCSNPDEIPDLQVGQHTLTVVGTDAYGVSAAPVSMTWNVTSS